MSEESEIDALRAEVKRLNDQHFFREQNSVVRVFAMQLLRGIAFGLGTVLGASILVSFLAYSLAQIDFIPIIGDWATAIAQEIETRR